MFLKLRAYVCIYALTLNGDATSSRADETYK